MSIKYKLSAVLAVGVLAMPVASFAQSMTVAQMQSQLATLLVQFQSLEQQLVAQGGGTNPASAGTPAPSSASAWCHTFNANLSVGQTGAEVTALQTALQKNGESVGVTGVFDSQTAAAVVAFQKKYASNILTPSHLSSGTGYVGSATRVELNSLYGCPAAVSTPAASVVPTPTASISPSSMPAPSSTPSSTPTVSISLDSGTPQAGQLVMGSVANLVAKFDLTAGAGNAEGVKITQLPIYDVVSPNTPKLDISNLSLWNGSTELGTASGLMMVGSSTEEYIFYLNGNPIIVPQGGSISLMVKGDVVAYAGGATDGQVNIFHVLPTGIVAMGQNSNTAAIVTGSAAANPQTVLRSTLVFGSTPLGASFGRLKTSVDQFATLSFSANSAGSIAMNRVNVSFSGSAVTPSLTQPGAVRLLDENNNPLGTNVVVATTSAGGLVWSFTLGAGINGQPVSAGATRNWTLVVNDNDLAVASGQTFVTLTATINTQAAITYTDGLSTASLSGLMLPASYLFPIQLNSVAFAQGM